MAHTDKWGNPVSHGSAAAIARLERAIELFAAYQADPVVELDGVLAVHPDLVMGHALRAALMASSWIRYKRKTRNADSRSLLPPSVHVPLMYRKHNGHTRGAMTEESPCV